MKPKELKWKGILNIMPSAMDNLKKRRARQAELLKEIKDDELGSPPGSENYKKMYNFDA